MDAGRCVCGDGCFSASPYDRGGPENGDGKPLFGWMLEDAGGGYWFDLAPEMTSEMEGRDCRFEGSLSSALLRESVDEIMPELGWG